MLLQLHAHLNAVFVHYVEFNLRFNIVDDKELEVRPFFSKGYIRNLRLQQGETLLKFINFIKSKAVNQEKGGSKDPENL